MVGLLSGARGEDAAPFGLLADEPAEGSGQVDRLAGGRVLRGELVEHPLHGSQVDHQAVRPVAPGGLGLALGPVLHGIASGISNSWRYCRDRYDNVKVTS